MADSSRTPAEAFRAGVELLGTQAAAARVCRKSQQAISQRIRKRRPIWAPAIAAFEEATGISRHELRPDIYPHEPAPPASHVDGVMAHAR